MNNKTIFCFLVFLFLLVAGCGSSKFYPSSSEFAIKNKAPKDCQLKFLKDLPTDMDSYHLLGVCESSGHQGLIVTTQFDNAYKELEKCACESGGNAIRIYKTDIYLRDRGNYTGSEMGKVKFRAQVIYLKNLE